jgi:hypothetical protein
VALPVPSARRPAGRASTRCPRPERGGAELLEARPEAFRTISWRTGTKGPLRADFAALRVRWPTAGRGGGRHLPGEEAWLVGERRATGERKYYLSNLPPDASLEAWPT